MVVSQESIFENKMICVVYWTVKSYILIPNWYGRCAKKISHLQKHCLHGTRWQRTTGSILFQKNHANIHMTWLSDLCLGQRVKLGNDVKPTNDIINYILSVKVCLLMVNHSEVITKWYFTTLILNGLFSLWVQYVDANGLL